MPKFPNNPRVLKAKLKSYETLSGIAHSIQLVALSKLQKLKKKIDSRHVSLRSVKTFIKNYYKIPTPSTSIYCVVFFTPDKSCCGAINNPILNKTQNLILTLKATGGSVTIVPVGRKGFFVLRKKYKREILRKISDLDVDFSPLVCASIVASELRELRYEELYIVFARFINNFIQEVSFYKLPSFSSFFNLVFSQRQANIMIDIFINGVQSNNPITLESYYEFMVALVLVDCFEETEYSQLGAKAKTMESALKNVTDTITILRIKYNKARQSIITNEIIEVLNATVAILE